MSGVWDAACPLSTRVCVGGVPGEVNELAGGVGVREGAVVDRGAEVCRREGRSMPKEQQL